MSLGAGLQPFDSLTRLAQGVIGSLDLSEVLDNVAQAAAELLPDSSSRIWVTEDGRLVLRSEAGTLGSPRSGRKIILALGEGLTGHVGLTQEPLVVEDVLSDPRVINVDWMRQEGYVSFVGIPLQVQDRLVGVLALLTRRPHRFTTDEIEILTSFGTQASIAIQNARLLQELKSRQSRLEALLEVTRQLSRLQPVESLLRSIAETCGALIGSDSVGFRLVEGDELVVAGTWGAGQEGLARRRLKVGESLGGMVAASGEPLLVQDAAADPRLIAEHRAEYRRLGYRAFLGVPVKVGERVLGVLSLRSRREEGFSREDLTVAAAFASQAAVALENSQLYQQIQQAHKELSQTQEQLAQSQKIEAVGRLAGGIAHDFNNLLTVITGRAQLLLARLRPGDPLRRDVDLIQKTGEQAATLTRQLLAFSRKQVLQPRVVDLNAVVADIETMLRRLIGEDIDLVVVPAPELGRVRVDPGQLEQVLVNLAVNARDAMPEGGRLTIETANVELGPAYSRRHVGVQPGFYVMLAVTDTGHGMDAVTQARLFEPFFTTKEKGKGTGLGLATVYGIVKQSGGNIWVYSEPGQGTTFKIYLPRVEEAVEAVEAAATVVAPPRGSETVLLVEDDEEVRSLVWDILQVYGYTVLQARHPGEALLIAEKHTDPIHLLLTDVVMPQMSGRQLAERLGRARREMKMLYMSGYTDNAVVHHGVLDSGMVYLQKPFTPDSLARKVREVLDAVRGT
jgi:signal transduction histidine kinase/ActR/RegA family two-component response regulator